MISQTSEKKTILIRWLLVISWAAIAAMLLNDTLQLNQIDSITNIQTSSVLFQGKPIKIEPYSFYNRLFWTIVVPLIPVSLLFFGHATWRRICPLSAIMQIPRKLNIQFLNKQSMSRNIKSNSWLAKNYWYLQFFILFNRSRNLTLMKFCIA